MDSKVIGGHLGLDVSRIIQGQDTMIEKRAKHDIGNQGDDVGLDLYDRNVVAIQTEADMLEHMEDAGYSPRLLARGTEYIFQDDVGINEPPQDMEEWRRNCIKMLATIRARGLRHGDLTGVNIITQGNHPKAVDWQEGHLLTEPAPQKQPWSDSYLLMRTVAGTYGPDGQLDTPRVARRWLAVLGDLQATGDLTLPLQGKTFLDLGCFQGDFVALAAAEGMNAIGVDQGGFRSGENSIEIAWDLWRDFPFGQVSFMQENFVPMDTFQMLPDTPTDVIMMFSAWPYVVQDWGSNAAKELLAKILKDCRVLYFETQLYGDGPGPWFLKTDSDIDWMFDKLGANATPIITIPVTGRPAERTVWRVTTNDE